MMERKEGQTKMSPEARVFRPRSETEDQLIDRLLKLHVLEGHIEKPSWTQYIAWVLNRDLAEVRARHKERVAA